MVQLECCIDTNQSNDCCKKAMQVKIPIKAAIADWKKDVNLDTN